MPRVDSDYSPSLNFRVNSWVFEDDDFKTEAKTNSVFVLGMYRTCTMSALGMSCKRMHAHILNEQTADPI